MTVVAYGEPYERSARSQAPTACSAATRAGCSLAEPVPATASREPV